MRLEAGQVAAAALDAIRNRRGGLILVAPAGVVTRSSSDEAVDDPQLAAALAHLRAHLHQPLDVPGLARAAGNSGVIRGVVKDASGKPAAGDFSGSAASGPG